MLTYDVIVIGLGGVGSAAVYHLARRGARVVGLDQFGPAHDRGSSHGRTRIIRRAYFEHTDYVPLVERSFTLWQELTDEGRRQLFFPVGLVEVGPPDGVVVPGVLASAQRFGLTVEKLSPRDVATRWPGLRVDDAHVGVYEPGAGYLRVEECILAHQEAAAQRGAELRCHTAVRNWTADGQGVTVQTDGATFSAGRLVIAAGPWASLLLGDLGVPLVVRRKPQYWVATRDDAYGAAAGHPAYLFETAAGVFYGFPQIDDRGIKVARHTGGDSVSDPSLVDRQLDPADWQSVAGFVSRHLPRATARLTTHSTCMYTMTPDEHFIVDRHPRHAQVALAAGLSGHGFKFTPVLGEALADLALDGASELPIEFLSLRRFAAQ